MQNQAKMNVFVRINKYHFEITISRIYDDSQITSCKSNTYREIINNITEQCYNEKVNRRQNGSPYFASNNKFISISHTLAYVATCVSESSCGIDIEKSDRNAEKIARKFCKESEIIIAQEIYPKNAHLLIWCAKEALYKRFSRDGAEFLKDFEIVSKNTSDSFNCIGFGQAVTLYWCENEDLLIVFG